MNIPQTKRPAQTAEVVRRRARRRLTRIGVGLVKSVFLIGFAFIILYPVLNLVSKAFMQQQDVYDNTVLWVPRHFTLENLQFAFGSMDYFSALGNTLLVVCVTTALQTVSCMLVGYGFARFRFKGKNVLFVLVVLTILIPPQQIMTQLYLYFRNFDVFGLFAAVTGESLNLLDSFWPFFVLSATGFGIKNGLFIFIFRQAFRGMPRETEEAAMVDGAGAFRTFWNIMVPGAVTIIATVVLFSFVWGWNDTFYSGLFLQNKRLLPQAFELYNSYLTGNKGLVGGEIATQLSRFNLEDAQVLALLRNAGVFLVMAPLLLFYAVTQKFFVESIDRSGLVG
ncbi:MAG: carbohydrate ABC transporter permease [Acutalibacteraceae bacterium]|nr:carbohydrate ABC transporter permease [Clostridiales bacterium]